MKLTLSNIDNSLAFKSTNETGQSLILDASPEVGGQGLGLRPMESLLASIASCASIDVLLILKKKRIELKHYSIEMQAERMSQQPARFKTIHFQFFIADSDPLETVQAVVALSIEKYCSVSASLSAEIQLTYGVSQRN